MKIFIDEREKKNYIFAGLFVSVLLSFFLGVYLGAYSSKKATCYRYYDARMQALHTDIDTAKLHTLNRP